MFPSNKSGRCRLRAARSRFGPHLEGPIRRSAGSRQLETAVEERLPIPHREVPIPPIERAPSHLFSLGWVCHAEALSYHSVWGARELRQATGETVRIMSHQPQRQRGAKQPGEDPRVDDADGNVDGPDERPDRSPPGPQSDTFPAAPRSTSARRRWTVVEQFEHDGFFYRLSRRPADDGVREPTLTKREQEALELASDGNSNKRIAAVLGVAPSTVGVLLYRAASKVGAKSRRELIVAYRKWKTANGS